MKNTILNNFNNTSKQFIRVLIENGISEKKEYSFEDTFTIGRSDECSIRLNQGSVSRVHAEVKYKSGAWWITDKNSSNGTYINGIRIDRIELANDSAVQLGTNGPVLHFKLEENNPLPATPEEQGDPSVTSFIAHYFDENENENAGQHTRMVRQAYKKIKKKQRSQYLIAIIVLGIIALSGIIYSIIQQAKENKQKLLAENIFYEMKSIELEIAAFRSQLSSLKDSNIKKALERFDEKHEQLERNYDKLVEDLGIYDLNEEDKLIVKTARIFGECEFAIPEGFISEVKNYIKRWQSSPRLNNALERARQRGFTEIIVNYLTRNQLPPQFFYLAMQESDFREEIVGPQTRYGYAKGIWQFISQTAERYGLTIGPLADKNVYDPADDRFNFPKATNAASKYLKDIYTTDAQASGLLVMASYNWGEFNIINLIRSMPENPRERNFWKLLEKYKEKIPEETYNYVFYIFSAAVICENPRLFGYNFDNPIKNYLNG